MCVELTKYSKEINRNVIGESEIDKNENLIKGENGTPLCETNMTYADIVQSGRTQVTK